MNPELEAPAKAADQTVSRRTLPAATPPGEDTIIMRGVRTQALIGIYAHERLAPQPLVIDLVLHLADSRCCVTDDIEDAVNYEQVVATVQQLASGNRALLLEAFAQNLADAMLAGFALTAITVTIEKPGIFDAVDSVAVSIHRKRRLPFPD